MGRKKVLYEDESVIVTWEDNLYQVDTKGARNSHLYTDEFELAIKFAFLVTNNESGMLRLQALTTKSAKRK